MESIRGGGGLRLVEGGVFEGFGCATLGSKVEAATTSGSRLLIPWVGHGVRFTTPRESGAFDFSTG